MERYNTLLQHYSKVSTTSAIPMPSLIYAEACVKVARFLQTVYANNGWSDRVLSLLVQGKVVPDDKPKDTGGGFISIATLTERKSSGIARSDISNWVTRIWNMPLDDLSLLDQVCNICYLCSYILRSVYSSYFILDQPYHTNVQRAGLHWISPKISMVNVRKCQPNVTSVNPESSYLGQFTRSGQKGLRKER